MDILYGDNKLLVLMEYYLVFFVHWLVFLLFECKYTQYTWFYGRLCYFSETQCRIFR